MGKLRLGVMGAGAWTVASHLPNLAQRRDEVEFVAVNRRDPVLREKIREQFGFQTASADYQDVAAAGIDICVVAGPVRWHHAHAKAALEAGAHVLVEKPFTIHASEAWDLVRTAQRVDRHLVLSLGWHYKPIVQEAKRLMESDGGIGEVEQLVILMSSTTRHVMAGETFAYQPDTRGGEIKEDASDTPEELFTRAETASDPAISGGGYAQAQLSHGIGLGLWLTELRGAEVFAFMGSPGGTPVEMHDAVSVRYTNDAVGTVSGGSAHMGQGNMKHMLQVHAIGSRGQLLADLHRELIWRYRGAHDNVRASLEKDAGLYDCDGPVHALVDIAQGRGIRNCSPGELGARTVEITEAAYRSAESGKLETVAQEAAHG